jgi:hypothetical protein
MSWVVDGLARKHDLGGFDKTRHLIWKDPLVYSGDKIECALLRDWVGRPVNVFFDFGAREEDIASFGRPILWHLHPVPERRVILSPVPVSDFVERLHKAMPFRRIRIKRNKTPPPPVSPAPTVPSALSWRLWHPESFQEYWRRRQRSRRRF